MQSQQKEEIYYTFDDGGTQPKKNYATKSGSNWEVPEIQDMIVGMTNTEIGHCVIHS